MRTTTKLNRSFGYLLAGAGSLALAAAACSGGKDGANGDGCPDDLAFFEANIWKPTLAQKCAVCHSESGLAKKSRLVLKPASVEGYLEDNFETVKKVAAIDVDGTSILLLRPSGRHPEGHPGGTLFEVNSPDYRTFSTFVSRVTKGLQCDAEVVSCNAPTPGAPLLRRLSRGEYDATIHDLLGIDPKVAAKFAADTVVKGFDNNARALLVGPLLADQVRQAAEDISAEVLKSPGSVLPCDAASGDAACATKFIDTFGKRAFRRPLTDADRTRYLDLYTSVAAQDGFSEGVKTVLTAMLQSPHFLYRMELGEGAVQKGMINLTPYEVATELSYFLWGSMPDDELFAAAESGALSSPEQIEKQARRLLADPRSDAVLEHFVSRWLELDQVGTVPKDAMTYPEFDANRAALGEETKRFVGHVMRESDGTLTELLTANYSFMNPELAKFYGLPAPTGTPDASGYAKIDLGDSPRAGILTQGSVIATHSKPNSSSPIHRGKLVRERLFCQDLPPPPPGLNVQPPAFDPTLTTRERYAAHATVEPCISCHTLIDPIGFGFERFDGIGRTRDSEGGKSVDTSGEIRLTQNSDGKFDGTSELAKLLAKSPDVHSCFVTQWMRFSYGVEEDAALSCLIGQVSESFEKGGLKVEDLMVALTRTVHFTQRSVEKPDDGTSDGSTTSGGTAGGAGGSSGTGATTTTTGGTTAASTSGTGGTTGSGGTTSPDLDVATKIDNMWANGYQESVTVTNKSGGAVTWKITLAVDGKISQSWNVTPSGDGGQVTFSGVDFNKTLEPGGQASFGFIVNK